MCLGEFALQNILIQEIKDDGAKVFGSRNGLREFLSHIQIGEVEFGYNLALQAVVQIGQIADHAVLVYLAADRDFQYIVVPVPMRIVALAIGGAVLGL